MKRIGILFGQENDFPGAAAEKINSKTGQGQDGIIAEFVKIDKVIQGEPSGYDVIIDRISHDVPFYRAFLKNEAVSGTAVLNNPFWFSADEKFFNNALAVKIGVPVPKTVILPSNKHPQDTNENSFRNLAFPLNWEKIFEYVGFPVFFKPFSGGGWKNVYKLNNPEELFRAYNDTGDLVMMLQEEIVFEEYYRCYSIDRRDVLVMPYDPRKPFHERYLKNVTVEPPKLKLLTDIVLRLNNALGYDINTVELAVRNGIPYAIDFCNPVPDANIFSVGQENFDWIVEAVSDMAIRRAKAHKPGINNLTWGSFVKSFANNMPLNASAEEDFTEGV